MTNKARMIIDIAKRSLKYILGSFLLLLILFKVLSFVAKPVSDHPYFSSDEFMVIAHRGGLGLGPEHTLYTYRRAVQLGIDVLEIDVRITKDGQLVVIHDKTVNRTTNGTGLVENYTLADIHTLDAAYRWSPDEDNRFPLRGKGVKIPSLSEVFQEFQQIRINIEIKEPQAAMITTLCRIIQDHDMLKKIMIASFNTGALKKFRSLCPAVATSAGSSEVILFYSLQKVRLESIYSPNALALQVPEKYGAIQVVNRRFVEAAHKRNLRVHVWIVNDIDSMKRLLKLGVDGIITDYPQQLSDTLKNKDVEPNTTVY